MKGTTNGTNQLSTNFSVKTVSYEVILSSRLSERPFSPSTLTSPGHSCRNLIKCLLIYYVLTRGQCVHVYTIHMLLSAPVDIVRSIRAATRINLGGTQCFRGGSAKQVDDGDQW